LRLDHHEIIERVRRLNELEVAATVRVFKYRF